MEIELCLCNEITMEIELPKCVVVFPVESSYFEVMNRLAVYSYLTRYPYGHNGSGRLFTVLLSEQLCQKRGSIPIEMKMRCWARQKLTDNYEMLV